jgi:lipoyl synthase
MHNIDDRLKQARDLSWQIFGKRLTVYLPGMFSYDRIKGRYPAISITGGNCGLLCDHCKGSLLRHMIPAETPEQLVDNALRLNEHGNHGILISGGCDQYGRLPWQNFIPAIREIKERTDLFISIHCGLVDGATAMGLKESGVDQALLDVVGDDDSYRHLCHIDSGIAKISDTLGSLKMAGIPLIPHVICGLRYGEVCSEIKALELITGFDPEQVVIVSLMPIRGTPLWTIVSPGPEQIAEIIAEARLLLPQARVSLGCARQRGDSRIETLAIDAGVNRMALASDEAIAHAKDYGLEVRYAKSCCSVSRDFSEDMWY